MQEEHVGCRPHSRDTKSQSCWHLLLKLYSVVLNLFFLVFSASTRSEIFPSNFFFLRAGEERSSCMIAWQTFSFFRSSFKLSFWFQELLVSITYKTVNFVLRSEFYRQSQDTELGVAKSSSIFSIKKQMFGSRTWAPPSTKVTSLNTDPKVRMSLLAFRAPMDKHILRQSHFPALLYPKYLSIPSGFNNWGLRDW